MLLRVPGLVPVLVCVYASNTVTQCYGSILRIKLYIHVHQSMHAVHTACVHEESINQCIIKNEIMRLKWSVQCTGTPAECMWRG